jgi:hypothetical protein
VDLTRPKTSQEQAQKLANKSEEEPHNLLYTMCGMVSTPTKGHSTSWQIT